MLVKPAFYDKFRCLASDCRHTCCAGWEIDVDADTAEYYASLEGEDGEFVRSRLHCGDGVQLCLEGERCRFLRDDNLCSLILRLGEGALCDICREHPRFYSGSENITLAGQGLVCEEAVRLWLSEPVQLVRCEDGCEPDAEELSLLERQLALIDHLAHGDGTLGERLAALLGDGTDAALYPQLRRLYASLEAMDADFCGSFSAEPVPAADARYAKLAAYFVYRYYFELGEMLAIRFAAASLIMIAAMGGEPADAARRYSGEVEYDPDNLDKIWEFLDSARGLGELSRRVLG